MTKKDLNVLSLGTDLTTLGFDINSSDSLYTSLLSPFKPPVPNSEAATNQPPSTKEQEEEEQQQQDSYINDPTFDPSVIPSCYRIKLIFNLICFVFDLLIVVSFLCLSFLVHDSFISSS